MLMLLMLLCCCAACRTLSPSAASCLRSPLATSTNLHLIPPPTEPAAARITIHDLPPLPASQLPISIPRPLSYRRRSVIFAPRTSNSIPRGEAHHGRSCPPSRCPGCRTAADTAYAQMSRDTRQTYGCPQVQVCVTDCDALGLSVRVVDLAG